MNNKLTQFKCLVTTFLLVAAMVMPSTAQAQTITPVQPGGEGTASIPYLISNAEQLYWFAGLVNGDASVCINGISQNRNAWAVLERDITVNSGVLKADGTLADDVRSFAQWTPIGNSSNRYIGNFDGQGHTISGLYFNNSDSEGGMSACSVISIKVMMRMHHVLYRMSVLLILISMGIAVSVVCVDVLTLEQYRIAIIQVLS